MANGRRNPLRDLVDQSIALRNQSTPEVSTEVPEGLFDPILTNPEPVNQAIIGLGNAQLEGALAADELQRRNVAEQTRALILAQLSDLGGSFLNLGGGNVQTNVAQRGANSIQQALGLQSNLTNQLADSARQQALIGAQTRLQTAQNTQQAELANAQATREARLGEVQFLQGLEDRARAQGQEDIANALNIAKLGFQERGLDIQESNASANLVRARAALESARRPRSSSAAKPKAGDRGFATQQITTLRSTIGQNQVAARQAEVVNNPPEGEFLPPEAVIAGVARDNFELEREVAANRVAAQDGLRRAESDEVVNIFGNLLAERQDAATTQNANRVQEIDTTLNILIDELRIRMSRNPEDPVLNGAQINAELLNNLEQSIGTN